MTTDPAATPFDVRHEAAERKPYVRPVLIDLQLTVSTQGKAYTWLTETASTAPS